MRLFKRVTLIVAVFVAFCGVGLPSRAGSLTPNPANPTPIPNGYTNTGGGFTVTVTPSPASFRSMGNCPWLLPALSAEGFVVQQGAGYVGANGWTVNFSTLAGGFTMNSYYPYATAAPAIPLTADLSVPAVNTPGMGGAVMNLTYNPKAGSTDPMGNNAEWIQVVRTNFAFGNTDPHKVYGYNAGGGYTYFIDNFYGANTPANNGTMNPTYDGGYKANGDPNGFSATSTTFIDRPFLPLSNGLNTQFQVFLATDNTTTKTLTIYDGVWWGFQVAAVPEPSTYILLLSGCGIVVLVRRSGSVLGSQ